MDLECKRTPRPKERIRTATNFYQRLIKNHFAVTCQSEGEPLEVAGLSGVCIAVINFIFAYAEYDMLNIQKTTNDYN